MVCFYTLIQLETAGSFTVSEHKTKILLFACQNMLLHLSFPKFIDKIHNVTVHINKH